MANCKKCSEPATHGRMCKAHYVCETCGSSDTHLCFYRDGLLCDACYEVRIAEKIANFKDSTDYTDEITCPHCGYVELDSWELSEGDRDCLQCDRPYTIIRHVTVQYTTVKADQETKDE